MKRFAVPASQYGLNLADEASGPHTSTPTRRAAGIRPRRPAGMRAPLQLHRPNAAAASAASAAEDPGPRRPVDGQFRHRRWIDADRVVGMPERETIPGPLGESLHLRGRSWKKRRRGLGWANLRFLPPTLHQAKPAPSVTADRGATPLAECQHG